MSFKIVYCCLQICLIKTVFSQCFGDSPALIAENLGLIGAVSAGPAGGPLLLQNPGMPTPGLSITADDLIIEGLISVSGRLPFVGTVALEGVLPTSGHGSVLYGCGNGDVGIIGEDVGPYGRPGPALAGPAYPGPCPPFRGPCNAPFIDPQIAAAGRPGRRY